jgi:uncharacterized repeat protein (TIGR03847 family)
MSEDPIGKRGREEAQRVRAEALGQPGERRFRLMAVIDGETRIVWMEKEDLRRLGQALEQVLANLPESGSIEVESEFSLEDFEIETAKQIRAGRMELGYDEKTNRLVLIAHDIEAIDDNDPAFVCRLTPALARELAEEAATVVAAGRPRCPLCGRPIDPEGHTCAKQNGHFPHRLEEVQDDEDDEEPSI